jgi:fatty-acyl-CoA synthase
MRVRFEPRRTWPRPGMRSVVARGDPVMGLTSSEWPADTSIPVLETTVGGVVREAAASHPDDLALVAGAPDPAGRRRWTFGELLAEAERAARALAARFAPGERVAVWAPGLPEWVVLEFGAALAGLTLVTVNPAYRADELGYVLGQSRAAGIFLVPEFRSPMAEYLAAVRPALPALREVVLFTEWDQFLASAPAEQALPDVGPNDIAQVQYTSGTTGFPKGALLTHRALTNNARLFGEGLGLRPGEVYANPMPMFHTAGCGFGTLGPLQCGAVNVLVPAFEPGLVLELLEAERADVMFAVPTMLIALLEHPDFVRRDLSSWRCVCSGGAPVPFELALRIEKVTNASFVVAYGMTECCPVVTMARLDDTLEDRANTLGQPVPQTEVKICDPLTGQPVTPGQVGELCARGYMVMAGYSDQPEATAAAIDGEGWYRSGDLASMDERGYLRIEGRIKDMIIRGGENIYPREIEDLLFAHPDVADAAVVGTPDERWGETVAAFIRASPGSSPSADELRAYCREHLAAYKCPQHWEFLDEFPLTPSGKIQKFKLRERLSAIAAPEALARGADVGGAT